MATVVPKLSSAGAVKIRFTSLDLGTTRWKEGTFEILEKDNKVNLCLRFNCGGASKTFQVCYCYFSPLIFISALIESTLVDCLFIRPQIMSYFHIGLYYCYFFVNVLRGTDLNFSGPFDYDLATFCTASR